MYEHLQNIISGIYRTHSYIFASLNLPPRQEVFQKILECGKDVSRNEWESALKTLSGYLFKFHGKPIIALVDHLEIPAQISIDKGYFGEVNKFLKNMFSDFLKVSHME
jgi:hypothetical protein